ncbi:MAG: hypothetical protein PUC44_04585, partial [Eubacteriales bacterium]|nr:hypothetical protein [Eubacteriales bacterium]
MAGSTASNRKNKKQGKKNTAKAASSRTKKKASGKETASEEIRRIQSERESRRRMMEIIWGLIYVAVGAFLFFSVQFSSLGGKFGAQLGLFLKGIFGLIGLLLPWYLIVIGILLIVRAARFSKRTLVLSFILLLLLCLLNSGRFIDSGKTISDIGIFYENGKQLKDGGFFGMFFGMVIVKFFGKTGLYIFSGTAALISLVAMLYTPWQRWWENRLKKKEEAAFVKAQSDAEETQRAFLESDADRRKSEAKKPLQSLASELAPPIQNAPVTEEKEIAAPSNFLANFLRKEPKKSNAADFLSQSDPFAETRTKGGHGFEEPDQAKEGFGLEGRKNSSSGTGLDPSVPPKEGYGLTDGRPKSGGSMPSDLYASNPRSERGGSDSGESSYPGSSSGEAEPPKAFRVKKPVLDEKIVESTTKEADAALSASSEAKDYKLPDISLLDRPVVRSGNRDMSELQSKAAILQRTLDDFRV